MPEENRAETSGARDSHTETQRTRRIQWAQALVLVVLFTAPALVCARMGTIGDPDVWWHLRSAEWIVEHRAVPHTDPFSAFGAGKPWAAYSWLYELVIFRLFQRLGLMGIVVYCTGMVVAIAIALHRLIRNLQVDFSFTVLLTAVAGVTICRLYMPRPWLFTILFFALEIDLLMQARKNGKQKGLLWLPLIFALWANLHIQFVDGLPILALALAETVLARWWKGIQVRTRPGWMAGIFAACLLATLANPYGWKIYEVAYDMARPSGALNNVAEMVALPFRRLDDWGVLLLALAATGVLARARRFALFEWILLAFAICVSFRSQRDLWVLVIASIAILAGELKGDENNRLRLTAFAAPFVVPAVALALLIGIRAFHVDNAELSEELPEVLPVRAVEVVREKGWSGPLYNEYAWGGYLIWALRMPVSIDGRYNVYGDERVDRSIATWTGQPGWDSDPDLAKAGLVIGPVKIPLTQLLRMDPHFQLVYEDKLAAVFVARKVSPSAPQEISGSAAHTAAK
jgi:hypothetical protein